jgi:hypothetical protein
MNPQSVGIPSFHESQPQSDSVPRRYTDAPTTVVKWGYVFEWCPTHPKAHFGSVQQHRLVIECQLGRFLRHGEVVHHRNHVKTDNSLENLELLSREMHLERHARGHRATPEVVARVAAAATDRSISFASLQMSPRTVQKICEEHQIRWLRRGNGVIAAELSESRVREALQGRTTLQAAAILGCHPQTLYNRFGHLLKKRTTPGALDAHCVDVLQMLRGERRSQKEVADKYGVSEACVMKSVQRWMRNPEGLPLPKARLKAIFRRWSRRDAKQGAPARLSTRHWSSKPGPQRKAPRTAA